MRLICQRCDKDANSIHVCYYESFMFSFFGVEKSLSHHNIDDKDDNDTTVEEKTHFFCLPSFSHSLNRVPVEQIRLIEVNYFTECNCARITSGKNATP